MNEISASDLSLRSGQMLARVDSGEELVVLYRGRPRARLIPYAPAGIASAEVTARLANALRPDPEWARAMDAERVDDVAEDHWAVP